jgi:hypothetical protein
MAKYQATKDCECGKKLYGYKNQRAILYMCYSCGKFEGENFSEKVLMLLFEEPHILMHLLETGFLKPIK